MRINVLPVGKKILVEPIEKKEEKLDSGLVLASTTNAELQRGKVVGVSAEISDIYSIGDVVLFPERKAVSYYQGGKEYLWLDHKADEVWGIETSAKKGEDKGDGL